MFESIRERHFLAEKFKQDLAEFIETTNKDITKKPNALTNENTCHICYDDVELIELNPCGHKACRQCWSHYIERFINEFKTLVSTNENKFNVKLLSCIQCDQCLLDYEFIRSIVNNDYLRKYLEFFVDLSIERSQRFIYCPQKDWVVVYNTKLVF